MERSGTTQSKRRGGRGRPEVLPGEAMGFCVWGKPAVPSNAIVLIDLKLKVGLSQPVYAVSNQFVSGM